MAGRELGRDDRSRAGTHAHDSVDAIHQTGAATHDGCCSRCIVAANTALTQHGGGLGQALCATMTGWCCSDASTVPAPVLCLKRAVPS